MMGQNQDLDLSHFSIGGQSLGDPNAAITTGAGGSNIQQMLAKLLMSKGDQKDGETKYVNGWAVPQSGMAGIGSLLGGLASSYKMGQGG
jgi:hypothetical protein